MLSNTSFSSVHIFLKPNSCSKEIALIAQKTKAAAVVVLLICKLDAERTSPLNLFKKHISSFAPQAVAANFPLADSVAANVSSDIL